MTRSSVIRNPTILILITGFFTLFAFVPIILARFLSQVWTVNATLKISKGLKYYFYGLATIVLLGLIFSMLYLSAYSVGVILTVIVIHIFWGLFVIFLSAKTYA